MTDDGAGRELTLKPDLLVLSTGIAPAADNPVLSGILRTALTADGFFLEAHPKLRPVDLANEGEFICGLAHSPRFIDETIAHARAAAGRAATVLSQTHLASRPDRRGRPRQLRGVRHVRQGVPVRRPDDQRPEEGRNPGGQVHGLRRCAASCPARTITLQHQEARQLVAMLDELLVGEARRDSDRAVTTAGRKHRPGNREIIAFCCNYCAYAAADLAGARRMQYPPNVRVVHSPCTGKIEMEHILAAFEKGIDGVLVAGCLEGGCHFLEGNLRAKRRTEQVATDARRDRRRARAPAHGQPVGRHGPDLRRARQRNGRDR